uniref:(northern house mosquito) hypothetical protein n=1 Tax=Culex pipiens TaxID=7175 RepID=A0A8D8J0N3_CULPI
MGTCTAATLLDSVLATWRNLSPAITTVLVKLVSCFTSVVRAALAVELVLDTKVTAAVFCFTISVNRPPRLATLVEMFLSVVVNSSTSAGFTMLTTFKLVMGNMVVATTTLTAVPNAM